MFWVLCWKDVVIDKYYDVSTLLLHRTFIIQTLDWQIIDIRCVE